MIAVQEKFIDVWGGKAGFKWSLNEGVSTDGKSEVDGKVFLGRVVGQMFVPDGVSDNQRFYPRSLWDKTLNSPELQERLKNRLIFGKIGHEDKIVTEEDLEKGRVSHVLTRLWIDEDGRGMGEALIYNTEAGRNLYTYLKGGSALKPSTRANGCYVEGRDMDGVPIVDEDSYIFETVDFVLYPGFRQASTRLVENKNIKNIKNKVNMEKTIDGNRILTEMIESRTRLQSDLSKALQESSMSKKRVRKMKGSLSKMKGLLENKNKLISELRSKGKAVCDKAISLNKRQKMFSERLTAYRKLGSVAQIKRKLAESEKSRRFFKGLAKPNQLARQLKGMIEELRRYRRIGKPHEIERAIQLAESTLSKYVRIGKPHEINRVIAKSEGVIRGLLAKEKQRNLTSKVERYSRKYRVPVEDMRSMLRSMPESKAVRLAESISRRQARRARPVTRKPSITARLSESYLCEGQSRAAVVFKNQLAPATNKK